MNLSKEFTFGNGASLGLYLGVAVEHEFDGRSRAVVYGIRTVRPS